MPEFQSLGATFHYEDSGKIDAPIHIVWGHGWGQSRQAFRALAQSLDAFAFHTFLDFPGFGESPLPPAAWGTEDYADAVAAWLATLPPRRIIWAGHSFGGRVGLQLASRHPGSVVGLFLIAGAGLKRHRSLRKKFAVALRIRLYKALKRLLVSERGTAWLKSRFGSADYRNAGLLRPIMVRTVNEDLSAVARSVACPVALVYGEKDTETPPALGERLAALIPNARLHILQGLDHHTVLTVGASQVAFLLHQFMESLP